MQYTSDIIFIRFIGNYLLATNCLIQWFYQDMNKDQWIGMEAEIQLPLKKSSKIRRLFSLILVGWCEEGHLATKNLLQNSQG